MNHILEIDNILLEKGLRRILSRTCLKCETGEVVGILGRNGSGKSCLFRIIYGELKADEGGVRMDGVFLPNKQRDCVDIRYLPQGHFIPGYLTLRRVFEDFGNDFEDFLSFFPEFQKYYISRMRQLSGGERRIVEIYTILQADTKFCLLDEPFAQVMPLHVEILKTLIRRAVQQKGILLTDHFFKDVMEVGDKMYVLAAGKILLITDTDDLKRLGYIHEIK